MEDQTTQWHNQSAEHSLQQLESTRNGLDAATVQQRLEKYGPNKLAEKAGISPFKRFLRQFHNLLIYVLIGAACMTALLGHWTDTGVIVAVVIINAIIGFIQEGKAEQAMGAIRKMLSPKARVIRAGQRHTIDGTELVPGDIVLVEAGDKVPADLRMLQSHDLQIQEALLTGESLPVTKTLASIAADAPLGDRTNLAFSGTTVTAGQGTGVVIATANDTEIGRISGLLQNVESLKTPLLEQMEVLAKWLTLVILAIAAAMLVFGQLVLEQPFAEIFMAVVGLAVAAIPEGLPAVLTITLAVGVRAMARRNAIVRLLPAIETLGALSVICSDKTGTFTKNEMTVTEVITAAEHFNVSGSGYDPEGSIQLAEQPVDAETHPLLTQIARCASLCNDADLRETEEGWSIQGDPMEAALLSLAYKAGQSPQNLHKHFTRTDVIPFDSNNQWMATLNHDHDQNAYIFVKGAPEKLLGLCDQQWFSADNSAPLDQQFWHQQGQELASQGLRLLALGVKQVPPQHTVLEKDDLNEGVIFLGMVGLIDPPRSEAIEAVAACLGAGIRVKMITGDHAITAAAIGKQIGLQNTDRVMTGQDLDAVSDEELLELVSDTDIFARTSPEHKLRLVMALQQQGLTVAMTGDGVNDAPALKRADAGIAMGQKGSEAAKEAADLVLADDNFATITAAVREGRTVYSNIRKVISWNLPTSAGEAMTIIIAMLLAMPFPITPVQILWVNMITAVTLGIALAFEPTDAHVMKVPPRSRKEAIITGTLLWQILFVALLFFAGVFGVYLWAVEHNHSIEQARTMAMNTLVMLEISYLIFIRNMQIIHFAEQNFAITRVIWITIGFVVLAQFAITFTPWLQHIFGTASLTASDGLLIVGVGVMTYILVEIEKQVRLRLMGNR